MPLPSWLSNSPKTGDLEAARIAASPSCSSWGTPAASTFRVP